MQTSTSVITVFVPLVSSGAGAQGMAGPSPMKGMDMSMPGAMEMEQKGTTVEMTEGEVRKLDKEQGLVTLRHGGIRILGLPGMTMVFHTTDKAMLDPVKQGDKVRFTADMVNNEVMATRIEVTQWRAQRPLDRRLINQREIP